MPTQSGIISGPVPWTSFVGFPYDFTVACSNNTDSITTGTAKETFRMSRAMTLTAVRASVTTAPAGASIVIDINASGSTILSTKITIEAGETTSVDATTQPVISDSSLTDNEVITIDFDQVGSSTPGVAVKVTFIGTIA
jgi:hypothetical protein